MSKTCLGSSALAASAILFLLSGSASSSLSLVPVFSAESSVDRVRGVIRNAPVAAEATPCDVVDSHPTDERKTALAVAITKQLKNSSKVDVLREFRSSTWSIVYLDSHQGDELFLFYAAEPTTHRYIAQWSGAARLDEEVSMRDWAVKHVSRIPQQLAGCFAWYATKGRSLGY